LRESKYLARKGSARLHTNSQGEILFTYLKKEALMLSEEDVLKAIGRAIQDPSFAITSTSRDNENWDSLGALSIITTLSKLTLGRSDEFPELLDIESALEIIQILRINGIVE